MSQVIGRVTLAATVAAGVLAATADAAPPLEIGKPFPDLVLPSIEDGRPMSVSQFRGRRLILQIFASW